MLTTHQIAENLARINERIAAACARSGRSMEDVTLIGVTKTQPAEVVTAAFEAGVKNFGENYAQEFASKAGEVIAPVRWHFIGHLQRNKVKLVAQNVVFIHSVDSVRLAAEISGQAIELGMRIPILLELNTSGEPSKLGAQPEDVEEIARELVQMEGVELQGLMTLAAFLENSEGTRPMFRLLRQTRDHLSKSLGITLPHLSMGMTADFETAIEEGATFIRIGTALFGARNYQK